MRPILTTQERVYEDEQIIALMYRLEMLHHRHSDRPSTEDKLYQVEVQYPLNDYANIVSSIGPGFIEPIKDDMPTDLNNARETSDVEDEEEVKLDKPPLNVYGAPALLPIDMED